MWARVNRVEAVWWKGVIEGNLRNFILLTEKNTFSIKEPVYASFLLPTHVLFHNREAGTHVFESLLLVSSKLSFIHAWKLRGVTRGCLRQAPAVFQQARKGNESRFVVYLVGFTGELAAAELALDLALGAVVLQVVGQVTARQLDGAAVGAGYHIEGAGGEVALRERQKQHQTY